MRLSILNIENKLEKFFEGKIGSIFNKKPLISLTEMVVQTIEKGQRDINGLKFVPNLITAIVKNKNLFKDGELQNWAEFIRQLIDEQYGESAYVFKGPIHVNITFDENIEYPFKITASFSNPASGKTRKLNEESDHTSNLSSDQIAFIILWNEDIFWLSKDVTCIGRSVDNDLVIDNLKVSRFHAQFRKNKKGFLLVDMNSVSGTKVNGNTVKQHQLSNGDVIELADVPLIFSIDRELIDENAKQAKTRALDFKLTKKTK
jgi:hypothetical protein